MVTQLERPDGSCVWNEMGYLKILNQKEKTVHTFLFYMVRHVMSTWWKSMQGGIGGLSKRV